MSSAPLESTNQDALAADAALMVRIAQKDADAYHMLVDQHLNGMVGLAHRMLNDYGEAEDVAQESFLKLWQKAPSWHPKARIRTWLFRVIHNACVDRLRHRRAISVEKLPDLIDSTDTPLDILLRKNMATRVREVLTMLPERQRVAVSLLHHLGFSQVEGASIMGVSVDAFESLSARGRRTLRKKLLAEKKDWI